MKHPFTDEELVLLFGIANRSIYLDFVGIAEDTDIADSILSGLQDKLNRFMRPELKEAK